MTPVQRGQALPPRGGAVDRSTRGLPRLVAIGTAVDGPTPSLDADEQDANDVRRLVASDRLLNVAEAAERLATTQRFVRRLVEERRIRVVKIGKFVRFLSTDLDDFLVAGIREALPRQ